jgi:glycogen operon protein
VKNFLTVLMLAAGTPMLLMGDEIRRTQRGNNNAYCLDDETNWFDWTLLAPHRDVHRFVKALSRFRQRRDVVEETGALSLNQLLERALVQWHGVRLGQPDWGEDSHSLAFTLRSLHSRFLLHVMLNAYWEPLQFEIPPSAGDRPASWRRCVDTAAGPPDDFHPWEDAPAIEDRACVVQPRSVVVLAMGLAPDAATPDAADA